MSDVNPDVGPAAAAPTPRPTARVLLVDDSDRLLLFSSRAATDANTRWYTVGGGVRPGESLQEAARREVREETGLSDVRLSDVVWTGRPWLTTRRGITYLVRQHYFLARVPAFDVDTSAFEPFERSMVTGHRWWTLEELRTTSDLLRPAGLPLLLERLLADGPPVRPRTVDG